ncbi:MAG: hypothetical protein ACMXYK_00315 [Candidatus Woesearchaeota archaeon]
MKIRRFDENPLINSETPGLQNESDNINGPSLIKVPEWVKKPLGKYYLYFAHHKGQYIKLAYSDTLQGPWKVYEPGTLFLEETPCTSHIASPDVHIDEENKKILMYYHGKYKTAEFPDNLQVTFLAESQNGIDFTSGTKPLGTFYFRVFKYGSKYYAFSKSAHYNSHFLESESLYGPFKHIKEVLPFSRHTAVLVFEDSVRVFYSRVGDSPESIVYVDFNMESYTHSDPTVVLFPEKDYEGINLEIKSSDSGMSLEPVRELRDPAIYKEGKDIYLLYTISGEKGIAIGKIQNI